MDRRQVEGLRGVEHRQVEPDNGPRQIAGRPIIRLRHGGGQGQRLAGRADQRACVDHGGIFGVHGQRGCGRGGVVA